MRRLAIALVLLCLPTLARAQPIGQNQTITVVDSGAACSVANTCAVFSLDSSTVSVGFSISGTWTGTLTFEATANGGIWVAVMATNLATGARTTTTTANGTFSIGNGGVIQVRARATAAMTGSAFVTAARGSGTSALNIGLTVPTDGSFVIANNAATIGSMFKVDALPTVASGFGTSPAVTAGSTPFAGSINVGTGVPGTGGVINFNGTAFPAAVFPMCMNQTTLMVVRCTATTTQLTIAAVAFTASDVVTWQVIGAK